MRVRLTWNNRGKVVTEEVYSLSQDSELQVSEEQLSKNVVDQLFESAREHDFILFEDEVGLFVVEQKDIIEVIPLENPDD